MIRSLQSQERQQEKFSYLIISKSDVKKPQKTEHWDMARLTSQVRRRPRHVQCQLCCANGELKQLAVTARFHGRYETLSFIGSQLVFSVNDLFLTIIVFFCFNRDMYRCARSSDWGDLLPMFHAEDDDTKNDKTQ